MNQSINEERILKMLELKTLTESQKKAITTEQTPILVCASAGSGKTMTLCNRILFKILNPNNQLTLQNLLVVSFTKAAAEEIYLRIKTKLNSLLQKFPNNLTIEKQLKHISKNNITTIDSFCSNFLKENFEAAKISPNFRIGNEIEIFEMKQKTLNEIFLNKQQIDPNKFQNLVDYFSLNSFDGLKNAVLQIFEKSRINPFPEQFITNLINPFKNPTPLEKNTKLTQTIIQEIIDRIGQAQNLILSSINCMDDAVMQKNFKPILEKTVLQLNNLTQTIEKTSYIKISSTLEAFSFEPLPRHNAKTNNFDKDLAQFLKTKFLNPAKKLIQSTSELLTTNEQFLQDCNKQAPIVKKLLNLCFKFSKKLEQQKQTNNTLEFSDLLLKTIKLLIKPQKLKTTKPKLTPLGEKTKTKFAEVLIDEFQDINEQQEILFRILSNYGSNLFMVGDFKQSIYRFRQAEPKIFLKYRNDFLKQGKRLISLRHNFRSRVEVTNATNFLFGQIMSEKFGGANYKKTDALIAVENNKINSNENNLTEFHILQNNSNISNTNFEMKHVANQIKHMIGTGFEILNDDKKQPCQPKHFAVLLRSNKTACPLLCEELDNLNIPYFTDEQNRFLNSYETNITISTLKLLNNPLDDIAFCAVAMSPLFGFDETELLAIKTKSSKNSMFTAFSELNDDKKCKFFLKIISNLQKKLNEISISRLIQNFYNHEIFNNIFLKSNNPNATLNNLHNFLNWSIELEQNETNLTLSDFLNKIELAKKFDINTSFKDISNPKTQNAVTITTIHKSKGLEFPIVFLPTCSKKFNKQNLNNPIIVSKKFGICLKHSNPETLCRYNTLQFNCAAIDEKNEAKAEELRLLYVAMTRAKQKLFLIATDNEKNFKNAISPTIKTFSASFCRSKNCFYDWLLAGFSRHKNAYFKKQEINFNQPEFDCNIMIKSNFENQQTDFKKTNSTNQTHSNVSPKLIEQLENQLNFNQQNNICCTIPAKMSVSEIANNEQELTMKKLNFDETTNPIDIGNAMHLFLQHANFKLAKLDLNREIMRLISKNLISKQQANCLNTNQLSKFLNSKIFDLIKHAKKIERERNFIFEIPSNKINPLASKNLNVIIQGTVDLIIESTDNTITIVDYKTDKTTQQNLKKLYSTQLKIYRHAIENLSQKKTTACLIYSFYSDSIIEI